MYNLNKLAACIPWFFYMSSDCISDLSNMQKEMHKVDTLNPGKVSTQRAITITQHLQFGYHFFLIVLLVNIFCVVQTMKECFCLYAFSALETTLQQFKALHSSNLFIFGHKIASCTAKCVIQTIKKYCLCLFIIIIILFFLTSVR